MTAREHEPSDDWMDVADAVGVTRTPEPIDPALAVVLSDGHIDAVLSKWSRDSTDGYLAGACGTCHGTGLVDARSWYTGAEYTVVCPSCEGGGDR